MLCYNITMNNTDLVLNILKKSPKGLTAYEILNRVQKYKFVQPMTIYRALKNLKIGGQIHKSNNKNLFKQKVFDEMAKLSVLMKESLLKGEVKHFADLLHQSWLIKQAMNKSITNKFVDDCYNTARKLGALGG